LIRRKADAKNICHSLERQSKSAYVSPYMIATLYPGLGGKNKALKFLEEAYLERVYLFTVSVHP